MNPFITRFGKWIAVGLLLAVAGWWWLRQPSPDSLARRNEETSETQRQSVEGPRRPPPLGKGRSKNSAKLPMLMEPFRDSNGKLAGYQLAEPYRRKKVGVRDDELSGWPNDEVILSEPSRELLGDLVDDLDLNNRERSIVASAIREMEARLKALEKTHCREMESTDWEQKFEITSFAKEAAAAADKFRERFAHFSESRKYVMLERFERISRLNGRLSGARREVTFSQGDDGKMMVRYVQQLKGDKVIDITRESPPSLNGIPPEWQHLFQLEP